MAYAGTPTGLAQQAGASRPWKTALAAIAVLAIGLALVIAVLFINSRAVAPATDRGFDQIEAQRGAAVLPTGMSPAAFLNAAAAKARAMSGVSADNSLDAAVRAAAVKAALSGDTGVVNTTSTAVEKAAAARARAMSSVPEISTRLDATSVDRKYHEIQSRGASQIDQSRGAHGPLK
jgi:hypothetical protein